MKTPHRASSLCCHETNDGRIAKLNHTPSMKAGQLSRHSCNQIPRGRYQQTKVQAGPEHQTRQPAAEGRPRGQRKEPQQRRANNKGSNRAHPSTARSATKPGRQRGAPTGAQNQHTPTTPAGQHAGSHKTTKGTEGSTDHTCAERSALDQRKGKKQTETENVSKDTLELFGLVK